VIAVVHLVWGPLGVAPVREFLASYRRHAAGVEHELIVLLNGVDDEDLRSQLLAELERIEHRLLTLPKPVQDLTAYAQAARQLEHERLCFVNSHSVILAAEWLAKLSDGLDQPHAGLVAATGSWASLSSWVRYTLLLPGPYSGVLPDRRAAKQQFIAIGAEREGADRPSDGERSSPPRGPSPLDRLRELPSIPEQLIRFGAFPAQHLRTNAFMAERAVFTSLRMGRIARKMDAYSLESGRNSITRQVQRRGLRALVVDRDGGLYDPERWPESRTFWQGDQEGLLIADNQTCFYSNGPPERRRLLSAFAWGRQADPVFRSAGSLRS